ncbi:MAG: cysteine--tRNA ligase [DPANN group archaeon]|nr:cysteine--tRNA ligase [DPANN group archaeon]
MVIIMALRLYNTLTRKKGPFREIKKGEVGMYSCGPTVYDYAHIGNFRAYITSDLLKRYLLYRGYKVKHVMNITDVDDKTIKNSREAGESLKDYTDRYTKAFFEDLDALNILPADVFPRATETITPMVDMIKTLLDKGLAYKGEDGSVYYNVKAFKGYGKLSGIRHQELKAGARVNQDEYTKDEAQDFALWKAWTEEDGDVFWDTPLGKGRPGWHIECSAMSTSNLGNHFDIHTGGIDLIFPHHENEIAQSEGCTGEPFVNYWVHNEWLLVEGKKMSKSLGNFYTLRDLLRKGYSAKAVRYLLLSNHYKLQANFTLEGLKMAENTIQRFREFILRLTELEGDDRTDNVTRLIRQAKEGFESQMDDDLNIGPALSVIFEFIREINKLLDEHGLSKKDAEEAFSFINSIDQVLGILNFKEERIPEEVRRLAEEREVARNNKDWKKADELRDTLKGLGYAVDDTDKGSRIKRL